MTKLNKFAVMVLLISNISFAQQEQAGIDLAESFPQVSPGNIEPDLPADGYYWDSGNAGWAMGIDVQANAASPSGYFLFGILYSYKDDGSPFWCAYSAPYEYEDVNQWRDAKRFSNLKYGHNQAQVMSNMNVECLMFENGAPFTSAINRPATATDSININLLWRTPTKLEITAAGGVTHYTSKLAMYDNLENPSLDWIMESHWSIMSNVAGISSGNNGNSLQTANYNVNTGFEPLDENLHPHVKDFVGHKPGWKYYISTVKSSTIAVLYRDQALGPYDMFDPIISVGLSGVSWIALIHDPVENRAMLFTLAGDKAAGLLRPDAGVSIKFVADVTHDSDVLDFYAYKCEGLGGNQTASGFGENCNRLEETWSVTSMANWSPRNVHMSSMKMFKLRTGGAGYLLQSNNGESNSYAEDRIKNQLIEEGTL